jgi:hypothetical protein
MTLKQVIRRLEGIATAHRQIKTVFVGDFDEFLSNGEIVYPACFIELAEQATISKVDRQTTYGFTIHFFDLLDLSVDSAANEFEAKSDLSSIAQDYMALLNYSEYKDWDISESNQMKVAKYQLADVTVGVSVNCNISTRYNSNRCQVPATDLPVENDNSMSIIANLIYEGLGNEGTSKTFATLINRTILMLFKGDKLLTATTGTPTVNEYKFTSSTGLFEFGNDIEQGQYIQILNKTN